MELEPITRQEKIIAGQDLTPITRMEMFLKNFGGGGGGSVPKPLTYDYMPEGYPKKTVQTVTLMEEQEVTFSDNGETYVAASPVEFEITEGETYTVVWDGVEYKCVCYTQGRYLCIGNPRAFGLEATDEPFVYTPSEGYLWISYDTATTHTISVTTSAETITPMAEEFLPILTSPNGTKYKITVDDSGTISATVVT